MEIVDDDIQELKDTVSEGARVYEEGGFTYIHLPQLKLHNGTIVEALLRLGGTDGYPTRLFLSAKVDDSKAQNWSPHRILDKTWWTWSWKDIPAELRPLEILLGHLEALR